METVLKLEDVEYREAKDGLAAAVIRNANGSFEAGRTYGVIGQASRDKSVILTLIAGLITPYKGQVLYKGKPLAEMNREEWRRKQVGLMLQHAPTLLDLSVLENVLLPLKINNWSRKDARNRASEILEQLGLDQRIIGSKVRKLSPMEQAAAAVARAIAIKPALVLLEESEWDMETGLGQRIMELVIQAAHVDGACVLVFTESSRIAKQMDEIWGMKNGVLLPVKVNDP